MARPTQFQKLSLQLDAENKKLKAKLANTKKSLGGISSAAKKMGGAIAAAFAVGAIVNFGREAMNLAGVAEGVTAAFSKLNRPALLNNLRKATRGTVSDLELMKNAVKADNFKVPLDKLASFFEFATKRSAQTGESVKFLVDSIVNGIGRKSTLVMDNLGISAAELQAEIKKTGDFGAAAGNIIERELAKAGDVATTSAQKMASWGATIDNIKVTVGTELNKALNALAPLVDKLMKGMIKGFKWAADNGRALANEFITLFNESFAFRLVIESLGFVFKTVFATIKAVIMSIWELLKTTKDLFIAAFTPGKSFADAIKKGFENIKNIWVGLGEDTAKAFGQGIKNIELKEKLPLLPTGDKKAQIIEGAKSLGADAAKAFAKEFTFKGGINDIGIGDAENQQLMDEIDLENELASITEMAMQNQINLGQQVKENQAEVIEGYASMAAVIGSVANGIANAKDNWAALGAVVASGIAQMVPEIQNVIKATKALFLAKQAEAVAGAAASSQTVPFPGNLVAMAASIGGVLASIAPFVGSFARGTNFIPRDGLAMVHQGEKILNRGEVTRGGGNVIAGDWVIRGSDLHFLQDRFNQERANSL